MGSLENNRVIFREVPRDQLVSYFLPNIYCKTWWKKNVNLDHLISQDWHLLGQREGASRGTSWKRRASEPFPILQ